MAILLTVTGRLKEAEAAYVDGLTLDKQLVVDFPDHPDRRSELAGTWVNLASMLNQRGDYAAAMSYLAVGRPHLDAALKVCIYGRLYAVSEHRGRVQAGWDAATLGRVLFGRQVSES
jgi:hypothetical protein